MGLPVELRLHIYEFIPRTTKLSPIADYANVTLRQGTNHTSTLLAVSKQVRAEAMSAIFGVLELSANAAMAPLAGQQNTRSSFVLHRDQEEGLWSFNWIINVVSPTRVFRHHGEEEEQASASGAISFPVATHGVVVATHNQQAPYTEFRLFADELDGDGDIPEEPLADRAARGDEYALWHLALAESMPTTPMVLEEPLAVDLN